MKEPYSTPHPDVVFRRFTRAWHRELIAEARAHAQRQLPCRECGSTARPAVRTPERGSYDWWDDPSPYVGCADCGAHLALLPAGIQYPWMRG